MDTAKAKQLAQFSSPTRLQKSIQVFAFGLSILTLGYGVLFYDFGPKDHCFVPIRREFHAWANKLMSLSDEEKAMLQRRQQKNNDSQIQDKLV